MNEEQSSLNQDEIVEYGNIKYLINPDENTASIIGSKKNLQKINIPISMSHKSKEYYVTNILEKSSENTIIEFIRFSSDSKLQTICENSFSYSTIKSIKIPSSVTSIEKCAFFYCKQLEVIEIPDDSKLQTIDKKAFSFSIIKSIRIPSELIDLKEGWCNCIEKLTRISVSPKNPRYCFFEDIFVMKTK